MVARSRIVAAAATSVVVLFSALPAGADLEIEPRCSPVVGSDFRVSGGAAVGDELDPAVAFNATDSEFLIVWSDDRDDAGRGSDVYGRRIGADGSRIGLNFRISDTVALGGETVPAVAHSPVTNRYLVVWQDTRNGSDIYGQMLAPNGSRIGHNFPISDAGATAEAAPRIGFNPNTNQFLVVWQDSQEAGSRGQDVYGQRIRANGSPVGGNFRISGAGAVADETVPDVAFGTAMNQYLVVWQDSRDAGSRGQDVYGQRIRANGSPVGPDFRISDVDGDGDEVAPVAAFNPLRSQFLVVWQDSRDAGSRGQDVYGQRLRANGVLLDANFLISDAATTTDDLAPSIVYNAVSDRYLVVYQDGRNAATRGDDVHGQRVRSSGALSGRAWRFSGNAAVEDDADPVLVHDENGNQYLVAWADSRNLATRGWDVYARRVGG